MHGNLYEKLSMNKLTSDLLKVLGTFLLIEDKLFEEHFPKALHFVDLIRLCLQPPERGIQNGELKTLVAPTMMDFHQALQNGKFKTLVAPTITELHHAGVNFSLGSSNYLFDIRFKNGSLEIPKLTIADQEGALITNLRDFEALNGVTNYVTHYFVIMSCLVSSAKDVEVLVQNGIIENWPSYDEDVSTLFQNLKKETIINFGSFYYYDLIEDLKAYCKSPWHKWKATLKQNYFNTPWASISVIAAVVLLILTVIQTVFFSIINK
ncbi:putative UPF0481 protein At3g02645 [Pistacia vera]|uniref:putative UPF0481 protein At3g02645 n=1 Tax=Pistacia vera TaxID=55513 RepID=UPI0012639D82|nr:putative UPF0481 protein At3g02645 [Pistacia vera]